MIKEGTTTSFYWLLYALGLTLILLIIGLFAYVCYCIRIKKSSFTWPINLLKTIMLFLNWVLFSPIFESIVYIYRCEGNEHIIDSNMKCYSTIHIILMVISAFFGIILLFECTLIALLFHRAQPIKEDALARAEINCEIIFLVYRTFIILLSTFVNTVTSCITLRVILIGSLSASTLLVASSLFTNISSVFLTLTFWSQLYGELSYSFMDLLLLMPS